MSTSRGPISGSRIRSRDSYSPLVYLPDEPVSVRQKNTVVDLQIQTKAGTLEVYRPNSIQRRLDAVLEQALSSGRPARLIGLKARQMGFSTWVQTRLFKQCSTTPNVHGLVVAHDLDGSDRLFRMARLFHESLPDDLRPDTDYSSRKEIVFSPPLRSSIHVQVAHQYAGSSHTIQFLHISELAKWSNPATTMLSLMQTVPTASKSVVIIESTGNGQDGPGRYFYDLWRDARDGRSDYTPLFFPWFEAEEYRISSSAPLDAFTAEEIGLRDRYGLEDSQLAWRRWAIRNLCANSPDAFRQEYPANDEEAFLRVEGTPVFDLGKCRAGILASCPAPETGRLRWLVDPVYAPNGAVLNREKLRVRFVPEMDGPLRVWCRPTAERPVRRYMGAADVAEGVEGGDYSSAAILDRSERQVVAVWHERLDATVWGECLAMLAIWYGAQIAPEVNAAGNATLARMMLFTRLVWSMRTFAAGDPTPELVNDGRYGWRTGASNHEQMVTALIDVIREGLWSDPDEDFWKQAMGVVRSANGKALITGKDRVACRCILAAIDNMAQPVFAAPAPPAPLEAFRAPGPPPRRNPYGPMRLPKGKSDWRRL